MATSSFIKNFFVTVQESIEQFKADMNTPRTVTIKSFDRHAENIKGVRLLKQRLLKLKKD